MKLALTLFVLVVIALHQDNWLWDAKEIVLGGLPVGLAYHGAFCVLASFTLAVLVRYAWPEDVERSVPETDGPAMEMSH